MAEFPSQPVTWRDFFSDTEHMSPEAAKAYLFLIGHSWIRGGRLKNDDRLLARLARVSNHRWRTIRGEVLEMLKVDEDGYLFQSRVLSDFNKVRKICAANSKKGRKGGVAKAQKRINEINETHLAAATIRSEIGSSNQNQIQKDSESQREIPSFSLNTESPSQNRRSGDRHAISREEEKQFDEWWSHWRLPGTKRGRGAALKSWRLVTRGGKRSHAELCADVDRLMAHHEREQTEARFIPHPATWINQERWLDDLVASKPSKPNGGLRRDEWGRPIGEKLLDLTKLTAEERMRY